MFRSNEALFKHIKVAIKTIRRKSHSSNLSAIRPPLAKIIKTVYTTRHGLRKAFCKMGWGKNSVTG